MRKYLTILVGLIFAFQACEPMPAEEGITLPAIDIGLKVSPDTAYVKLGDTVYLTTSVPSTLSNGVKLEDGKAKVDLFAGYTNQVPITEFAFEAAMPNEHLLIFTNKGKINISTTNGKIKDIDALPYGDSLQLSIAFVPQKKGTYTFYIQSMFYEGKKGKTRTQPSFINTNHNFDELWRINANDYDYDRQYLFAVTD